MKGGIKNINNLLVRVNSNCNAPVKVVGKTTKHYVCAKCNKACDVKGE